jgi:hypothetical protein
MNTARTSSQLPTQLSQIDAGWIEAALQDCFPGVRVTSRNFVRILQGTSTKALLEIDYADRAGDAAYAGGKNQEIRIAQAPINPAAKGVGLTANAGRVLCGICRVIEIHQDDVFRCQVNKWRKLFWTKGFVTR